MKESTAVESILLFSSIHTKMSKRLDNQLSIHGISFNEYLIMHRLYQAPNRTMRRIELAEQVGLSASGVTRLLAPMEKNKITEKEVNPRDARMSLVKLSSVGERLYKETSVSFEHTAEAIAAKLKPAELNKFLGYLSLLL